LPRLRGKLGMFLALTGFRLKGLDVLHAGVATHFVKSEMLKDLETALIAMDSEKINKDSVGLLLSEFQFKAIGHNLHDFVLKPQINQIEKIFGGGTIEEILKFLQIDGSDWAKKKFIVNATNVADEHENYA